MLAAHSTTSNLTGRDFSYAYFVFPLRYRTPDKQCGPESLPGTNRLQLRSPWRVERALDCAIHYENWELSKLRCTGLPQKTIGAIYLQSIHWANQVLGSI